MIARFSFLLPFELSLDPELPFPPIRISVGPEEVRVLRPARALLDPDEIGPGISVGEVPARLVPAADVPSPFVMLNNKPALQANLLMVEFQRATFDRTAGSVDPPLEQGLLVANEVLTRLRLVGRTFTIKLLQPDGFWRLDYLNDDGSRLEPTPLLVRARVASRFHWQFALLTPSMWTMVEAIPSNTRRTWEDLILDAFALLPEVGPALVMAHSALETFARWVLDRLVARVSLPAGLWDWIMERKKEPPLDAQLDELLRFFSGHSLKERNDLWEGYKNLKIARDNFTHRGEPLLRGTRVTHERAIQLLQGTILVIDWIETLLPTELRRPAYTESNEISYVQNLFGPLEPPSVARDGSE